MIGRSDMQVAQDNIINISEDCQLLKYLLVTILPTDKIEKFSK